MFNSAYDTNSLASLFYSWMTFGALINYVIQAFLLSMFFKKVGIEQWRGWVPVYNLWVFLELGNQKGIFSLLVIGAYIPAIGFIFSLASTVFSALAAANIGPRINKPGVGWIILYIFLSPIWLAIAAFDKDRWYGPLPRITGRS